MKNIIEFGDCREIMRRWKSEGVRVQTCVTSPPYYGLRDYGHSGQIGLEETPQQYVDSLVEVFRCVRDILKDDGTVWLNLGDSYAGSGKGQTKIGCNDIKQPKINGMKLPKNSGEPSAKNLIGIPWKVAFALQDDGWILRSDIIWNKLNPMPEPVTDRPTKSHEYIFLLSKNKDYYYDADAIKEDTVTHENRPSEVVRDRIYDYDSKQAIVQKRHGKTWQERKDGGEPNRHGLDGAAKCGAGGFISGEKKNKRSVWTMASEPYQGAHFATFPTKLITPCILAGCPADGIVLDPFMGSGTTAYVAKKHMRNYLGCELNPKYKSLQDARTAQEVML